MNELKPCPFCQSAPKKRLERIPWGPFVEECDRCCYVVCGNKECSAFGPTAQSREMAIEKWNRAVTREKIEEKGASANE